MTPSQLEWEQSVGEKGRQWELSDVKLHPLHAHQPASRIHMLTFLSFVPHSSPTLSVFTLHRHLWKYNSPQLSGSLKKKKESAQWHPKDAATAAKTFSGINGIRC